LSRQRTRRRIRRDRTCPRSIIGSRHGSYKLGKNQLTTDEFGNSYYAYDNNRNPTTYKGQTLTYDQNNNLTAYGSVFSAGYRADGLRAWKQEGATKTYYIYDGDQPIIELDPSGGEASNTVFGVAGPISTGANYYAFDEKGNCQYTFFGSATSPTFIGGSTDYGVSPSIAALPYAGFKGAYGYRGDVSTGLYYCTHRYYDTTLERWLTRDPIGDAGGVNLYEYCDDNPITNADATGLIVELASINGASQPITQMDRHNFKLAMNYLRGSETMRMIWDDLQASAQVYKIVMQHTPNGVAVTHYNRRQHKVYWDPHAAMGIDVFIQTPPYVVPNGKVLSAALGLGHELTHAWLDGWDQRNADKSAVTNDLIYGNVDEWNVIGWERDVARELGEPLRYNHYGDVAYGATPTSKIP
jgi:RHS repeat-associated protein